jgi:hypothetical protein
MVEPAQVTREELFDGYPAPVLARFKKFHTENPQVYKSFKARALRMHATGREKYSARTIVEVMRWHYDIRTTGDVFEINDDYVPLYARLFLYHHFDMLGFFELRTVKSRGIRSEEERRRRGEGDDDESA